MIRKILIEEKDEKNYELLSEDRKQKYIQIIDKLVCSPEEYIVGVDIISPESKDTCVVVHWLRDDDCFLNETILGAIKLEGLEFF